jgi:hypothetical protein
MVDRNKEHSLMPRKTPTRTADPFVVVVTFPSSSKEYHYLCNDPTVRQGSTVIANRTKVKVLRTAPWVEGGPAFKYVESDVEATKTERKHEIAKRLNDLLREEEFISRASKLKSAEGRRLVRELKELTK